MPETCDRSKCPANVAYGIADGLMERYPGLHKKPEFRTEAIGNVAMQREAHDEAAKHLDCPGAQISHEGQLVCPLVKTTMDGVSALMGPSQQARLLVDLSRLDGQTSEAPATGEGQYL